MLMKPFVFAVPILRLTKHLTVQQTQTSIVRESFFVFKSITPDFPVFLALFLLQCSSYIAMQYDFSLLYDAAYWGFFIRFAPFLFGGYHITY